MERELWREVVQVVRRAGNRRPAKCQFTDEEVVLTFLWAVLHDRPISWACRRGSWPVYDRRRALPTPSTMSRRLRWSGIQRMLDAVESALNIDCKQSEVHAIDGKSLPIGGNSSDPDCGYGRAAGCKARGYKLHVIYSLNGNIAAWDVHAIQVNEHKVGSEMVRRAGIKGYLLGDKNYDANHLFETASRHGLQLLAPRRYGPGKGLGHIRHSPARLRNIARMEGADATYRSLHARRTDVERFFGTLSSAAYGLMALPPWVRRLPRVRRWVQGKLIMYRIAQNKRVRAA